MSNKSFLRSSILNGQLKIQLSLRQRVKVNPFDVGEHDVCSPVAVARTMPDQQLERLEWERGGVERGINSSVESFANKAGAIVRTSNTSLAGVNPTALYGFATSRLGRRFQQSLGPDARLLEELHLNCPGCTQKFDQ